MLPLEIFVVLDIILAAFVASLLTRFWTAGAVEESVDQLERNHRTWGIGGLLFIPGILLNVPAALMLGESMPAWADLAKLAGYPLFMAGIYLMFQATIPQEVEA